MNVLNAALTKERDHFLQVIREACVIPDPFPHALIDGAFSEDFLEQLYRNLPDRNRFNDAGHGLHAFQIWDQSDDLQQWTDHRKAFWEACNQILFDDSVAAAFHELFSPARVSLYQSLFGNLANRRLSQIKLQPWASSGALNIRSAGSSLPTHMDWPNRLYSLILYLDPDITAQPEWGTRLFHGPKVTGQEGLNIMAKRAPDHVKSCRKEAATLIPFKPGRVAIFMNTPWSYHGASVNTESQAARWCLVKGINMTLEATENLFGLPPELN
ncbi:MAG: hypothetical protein ACFE0K_13555 [Alcanivorax sp.]|uniref:hypothetical protein n=1 Tax=Alcanivorax sp. TaxID=1872427 RepID=UPI003DA6D567